MHWLRICRLALSLSALLCASVSAQRKPLFTSPLPTGVRLDPAGEGVDLGSFPINLVFAPETEEPWSCSAAGASRAFRSSI